LAAKGFTSTSSNSNVAEFTFNSFIVRLFVADITCSSLSPFTKAFEPA